MSRKDFVTVGDYDSDDAKQFIRDAELCDLVPFHYRGRFYWEGPAVRVSSFGEFKTDVPVQHDSLGLGFVVYPVEPAFLLD